MLVATTGVATGKWGAVSLIAATFQTGGACAIKNVFRKIKSLDSLPPWVLNISVLGIMGCVIIHVGMRIRDVIPDVIRNVHFPILPVRISTIAFAWAIETQPSGFGICTAAIATGT